MNILIVCTGNICRSPMAEAMLRRALDMRGLGTVEVTSAGTWGNDGWNASQSAVDVLAARGIELSDHVARSLTVEQLEDADLVLVMTEHHARDVVQKCPAASDKTRYLKEISELDPGDIAGLATPKERLDALLAVTRPPYRRALELDDPYGLPLGVYERTAAEIAIHVERLAGILAGETGPGRSRS